MCSKTLSQMLAATGEGHSQQTNLHDMQSMLDAKTTTGGCFVKLNLSIIAFQLLKHFASEMPEGGCNPRRRLAINEYATWEMGFSSCHLNAAWDVHFITCGCSRRGFGQNLICNPAIHRPEPNRPVNRCFLRRHRTRASDSRGLLIRQHSLKLILRFL